MRLRALILAAGFGQRLRPLTHFYPKPLLPVCGESIAGLTLDTLRLAGCELAVLNLHYLAEQIPEHFGESHRGLPIHYSHEAEIQGTLGALVPPREVLEGADLVLLVNGDSLCDWPWKKMIRHHLKTGARATLLLHRQEHDAALGGGVGVDSRGRILQIRDDPPSDDIAKRHVFAGAHVLDPSLLDGIEEGPGDIITGLYQPLLRQGERLEGVFTSAFWHDLGTPSRYLQGVMEASKRGFLGRFRRGGALASTADLDPSATLKSSIVEAEARVGEGARVTDSILLPSCRVEEGARIQSSVVGPGVRVSAGSKIEGHMVTRLPPGYAPSPKETVMGEQVFTPL